MCLGVREGPPGSHFSWLLAQVWRLFSGEWRRPQTAAVSYLSCAPRRAVSFLPQHWEALLFMWIQKVLKYGSLPLNISTRGVIS